MTAKSLLLRAMFGLRLFPSPARNALARVAIGAVLAFGSVLALASGEARALCLDLGGTCSPSTAGPTGPCHDQEPEDGANPSCTSCVDIIVHDDAASRASRPDHELPPPVSAHPSRCGAMSATAAQGVPAALAASTIAHRSPHPFLRSVVLLI